MLTFSQLDALPENVVVVSGGSLLSMRHLPVPPNLITVIRDPRQPGLLYEILKEELSPDHTLFLPEPDENKMILLSELAVNDHIFDDAKYLVIPPLPDRSSFEDLQNTVAILRGPHGCPWDKKQTHQSIRDDFLQEVYELLDGLDRGNTDQIVEELGDVLFHVVLQTQMGIDHDEFTMGDVIRHINDKIISRHIHVFGNPEDITPDQVVERWEQIKQKEREKQHKTGGLLDGISLAMPALSQAFSCQKRAAKAGFEWIDSRDIWAKLAEELEEFKEAQTPAAREEELGDILFCIASLARWYEIDPESALRMAILKFRGRIHYVENRARGSGKDLFALSAEEKIKCWNEAKTADDLK